ncbi:MAG: adenosylcobinamide-phosphate synthase CbiB [Firmicutes bacterium]|nr:adenosylcobinamide-phosphate synthase CbiB [Bacillota bacterium]
MAPALPFLAAAALDLLFGDPPRPTHPVVLIGRWIAAWERLLYGGRTPAARRLRGAALVLVTLGAAAGLPWAVLAVLARHAPTLGLALAVWWLATSLAARDLAASALAVRERLVAGDLPGARRAVGRIVGRETAGLDEPEVVRAAVESVAENANDGVVAPLFWAWAGALLPPPGLPGWAGAAVGALAYKAVNTLDSMVGYRSPRYLHFGWASARLDDLANWLPARLAALLAVAAAPLAGASAGRAWRTLRRDGRKHPSPNSGLGEAAYAGALGVRLGGLNVYGGRASPHPYLGEPLRPLEPGRITEAVRLLAWTGGLAVLLAAAAAEVIR